MRTSVSLGSRMSALLSQFLALLIAFLWQQVWLKFASHVVKDAVIEDAPAHLSQRNSTFNRIMKLFTLEVNSK